MLRLARSGSCLVSCRRPRGIVSPSRALLVADDPARDSAPRLSTGRFQIEIGSSGRTGVTPTTPASHPHPIDATKRSVKFNNMVSGVSGRPGVTPIMPTTHLLNQLIPVCPNDSPPSADRQGGGKPGPRSNRPSADRQGHVDQEIGMRGPTRPFIRTHTCMTCTEDIYIYL